MRLRMPNVSSIFVLLCTINMLNYIDRGIIPGSPLQFEGFIAKTLGHGTPVKAENTFMGLLVSSFIAGYSVFSIAFGYWAIYHRPFHLIAAGMATWCVAVLLCGLAYPLENFSVLIIGRVLSGVGESSFQALAPSFIEDYAPSEKRTLWLGVFYCGITVGTAAGYFYSAIFAGFTLRWSWAFYCEGLLMIPLVCICLFCIPFQYNIPGNKVNLACNKRKAALRSKLQQSVNSNTTDVVLKSNNDTTMMIMIQDTTEGDEKAKDENVASCDQSAVDKDGSEEIKCTDIGINECIMESTFSLVAKVTEGDSNHTDEKISLAGECLNILKSPLFLLVSLGSAAYVFSISGLGAFGPSLLIGLGLFEESTAAMVFGGIVVVAGTIGTLFGGYYLDRSCYGESENEPFRMYTATRQLCTFLTCGTSGLVLSWLCLDVDKILCISVLAIALAFLFGCVPASVVAILLSVDKRRRGLALGINTLLSHVLGDVPSPIVLGLLKDIWSPKCSSTESTGELNPECTQDRRGLKMVLLFPYLWLLWAIVLAAIAVNLSHRKLRACIILMPKLSTDTKV